MRLEFSNSNHASSGLEHTRRDSGPHLTLQQQFQSKNAVITLKKCRHPKAKLEQLAVNEKSCAHPENKRITDDQGTFCGVKSCGLELENSVTIAPTLSEVVDRKPTNRVVFGGNKGVGSEGLVINAVVQSVQGGYNSAPMRRITKTCPKCQTQQPLEVFGPSVTCEKCGIELAHFILRWLPQNNGHQKGEANESMRFLADKKLLQIWTPPEGNPVIRTAQELFSKKVQGKLSDEAADRLAALYLKNVRKRLPKKRELAKMLDATLVASGVRLN
jgi:hypothetical protein